MVCPPCWPPVRKAQLLNIFSTSHRHSRLNQKELTRERRTAEDPDAACGARLDGVMSKSSRTVPGLLGCVWSKSASKGKIHSAVQKSSLSHQNVGWREEYSHTQREIYMQICNKGKRWEGSYFETRRQDFIHMQPTAILLWITRFPQNLSLHNVIMDTWSPKCSHKNSTTSMIS